MKLQEKMYWLYDYGCEACNMVYLALAYLNKDIDKWDEDTVTKKVLDAVIQVYNNTYALTEKFEVKHLEFLFDYFDLKCKVDLVKTIPKKGYAIVDYIQYHKPHGVVFKDGKEVYSSADIRYGFDYENYHNGQICNIRKVIVSNL